jgi:hypothetical protein
MSGIHETWGGAKHTYNSSGSLVPVLGAVGTEVSPTQSDDAVDATTKAGITHTHTHILYTWDWRWAVCEHHYTATMGRQKKPGKSKQQQQQAR